MTQNRIIKAPVAWVLLKFSKVETLGFEPYFFIAQKNSNVGLFCGWLDGYGDEEIIEYQESDKLQFVKDFNNFYPAGIIQDETPHEMRTRIANDKKFKR